MTAVEGPAAMAERIARELPQLRPLLEEIRGEQLGEMWPAVFLDEATRGLVGLAATGDQEAKESLTTLARILEPQPELDVLVSAFLSPLPYPDQPGADLVRLLGPRLTAELARRRDWRTRPQELAFVDRLVKAVPALAPLAAENRAGSHRQVLPHQFLADVADREVENYRSGDPAAQQEVRTVLERLEAEYGLDGGVDNAIAASFVENLPYAGDAGADLVTLLGPKLAAVLREQR